MPVNLRRLATLTPFLYHVTHQNNLNRIQRLERLDSTATMLESGGQTNFLDKRREQPFALKIGEDSIVLTDQGPLHAGHIKFENRWQLTDLVRSLNCRVFFWRGTDDGLLAKNMGHFQRYENYGQRLVVLRIPFVELIDLNLARGPELCKYNSGAPRSTKGRRSPRGPSTFVEPQDALFNNSDVREVTFRNFVVLPKSAGVCYGSWSGPFHNLF